MFTVIKVYIKLVVVVNVVISVDKFGLLHKINSLIVTKRAGQGLYRSGMDGGEKKLCL
jgi:hypothetical protein